jgi:hypothetical protein
MYDDDTIGQEITEVLEQAQGKLEEIGWEAVTTDWAEAEMPNNPAISFKVPGGYLDLNAVFRPD